MHPRVTLALITGAAVIAMVACGSESPASDSPSQAIPEDAVVQASEGAALYTTNCVACHGDRDGTGGIIGAPRHDETGHTWHHPDAQLIDWVLNGKLGFSRMPALKDTLSEEQVESVLAYIKTWWAEDQRTSQADISARYQIALDAQKAQ